MPDLKIISIFWGDVCLALEMGRRRENDFMCQPVILSDTKRDAASGHESIVSSGRVPLTELQRTVLFVENQQSL